MFKGLLGLVRKKSLEGAHPSEGGYEESPEQQAYLARIQLKKTVIHITQLLILICFFGIWELSARWKWMARPGGSAR